jgi:hypothetical protein
MRRYIIYLSVALLAFGLSTFVVIKFFLKTQNSLPKAEITNDFKVEVINSSSEAKNIKKTEFTEIKLKKLPCEDKNLQLVWNDLEDETTSVSAESAKEIKNCSDIIEVDEPTYLNNDGQKEVVIRGWRSPYRVGGDGVTFWIFREVNKNEYRKVFEGKGSFFYLKNTKTKGYRDITVRFRHNSAEYDHKVYKFNGTKYAPKQCRSESYLYKNKDGELVEGKTLKIEPYKCNELE